MRKNELVAQTATVRTTLEKMAPQFALALPKHLTPDRLLRVAMTTIQNTPKLLECDRTSLYASIMCCAQLGLEPDGVLGQAYLVPFKGKVQFIPGYRGLIALARNSGNVTSIQAHEVCERDEFTYAFGLDEKLEHVPARGDRGDITHFYAYAKFKDGGHAWDVMTREDVDAIRAASPGKNHTPWSKHYVQMGRKTAIRRLANYLPLNVQKAAAMEGAYEGGKHSQMNDEGGVTIDGDILNNPPQEDGVGAASQLDGAFGDEPKTEKPKAADIDWREIPANAEVLVTMMDGTSFAGTFKGENKGEIQVDTDNGASIIETAKVANVQPAE